MPQFDPYRKWLGIPESNRPPNFYELLGIPLFEQDIEVVHNAADARMTYVRTFATGTHNALSQRILNEISQARVVLGDPAKKAGYDATLRNSFSNIPRAVEIHETVPAANREADSISINVDAEPRRKRRRSLLPIISSAISVAVFALMIFQLYSRMSAIDSEVARRNNQESRKTQTTPHPIEEQAPLVIGQPPTQPHDKETPAAKNEATSTAVVKETPSPERLVEDNNPGHDRQLADLNMETGKTEKANDTRTERLTLNLGQERTQSQKIKGKKERVKVKIVALMGQRHFRTRFDPFDAIIDQANSVNIHFVDYPDVRIRCEILNGCMTTEPQVRVEAKKWTSLTQRSIRRVQDAFTAESNALQADIRRLSNQRVPTAAAFNAVKAERLSLEGLLQEVRRDIQGANMVGRLVSELHGIVDVVYEGRVEHAVADAPGN